MSFNLDNVTVGDKIPHLMIDPIKRSTLALYAGASGDHNPIHIDLDFAKKVGMTQIFDESGTILPVTILKTELCQVSQIKTKQSNW